jgi:hypothetical protein
MIFCGVGCSTLASFSHRQIIVLRTVDVGIAPSDSFSQEESKGKVSDNMCHVRHTISPASLKHDM